MTTETTTYYALPEWHGYGVTSDDWEKVMSAARVRLDKIREDNAEHDMLVPEVVTIDVRERVTKRDDDGTMVSGTDSVVKRYRLEADIVGASAYVH